MPALADQAMRPRQLLVSVLVPFCGSYSPVEALLKHTRDRWSLIYVPLCGAARFIEDPEGDGIAQIGELVGFPVAGVVRATHFCGSPLEQSTDEAAIRQRITDLACRYGWTRLGIRALHGWSTPQFYAVLEALGYRNVEVSTLMMLHGAQEVPAPGALPAGYTVERVRTWEALQQLGALHGGSAQFVLQAMDRSAVTDPRLHYWAVRSGSTMVCTTAVEIVNGIAGIHLVETAAAHRRKGLASVLVATAIRTAFAEHPDTAVMLLGSTHEAVGMYTRLGFQTHGHYDSFEAQRGPAHM